jgi:hypothetical protein
MTVPTNPARLRAEDPDESTAVPRTDADVVDATVQPVGTFAAGQSAEGRYVAVTAAPQGDFAVGQADEDEPAWDEADEDSPEPPVARSH